MCGMNEDEYLYSKVEQTQCQGRCIVLSLE